MNSPSTFSLPYKSTAIALLLCAFLGPVGLLYASFWGGFFMIFLGMVIINSDLFPTILLFWAICCIWGVGAVERYNKKLLTKIQLKNLSPKNE